MTSQSFSSSIESSIDEPLTEQEKEIMLFTAIKLNILAVEKSMQNVNLKFKKIQKSMHITEAMMDAIEIPEIPENNQPEKN